MSIYFFLILSPLPRADVCVGICVCMGGRRGGRGEMGVSLYDAIHAFGDEEAGYAEDEETGRDYSDKNCVSRAN